MNDEFKLKSEGWNFFDALREHKVQILLTAVLLVGLFYPIIKSMVVVWRTDSNFSHGFIVPVIAAYFLYKRSKKLEKAGVFPNNIGLPIIILGLLLLAVAHTASEMFTMGLSLIIVLAGIVLYFFGKEVFKIISLPLGYLIFMIPVPYIIYNSFAVPLKLFVAKYSVLCMNVVGINASREANFIMLGNVILEVSDDCSGMRSLMSLLTLSVALAFLFQTTVSKRVVVILSAVPIAVFTNMVRIILTGILAEYWSVRIAEGFSHEFAGVIVFCAAFLILLLVSVVIGRVFK